MGSRLSIYEDVIAAAKHPLAGKLSGGSKALG
jgi:hypothetical protein